MQAEERCISTVVFQLAAGALKKKNACSTAMQNHMNTLYDRYNSGLINASNLLTGFSLLI
jgi:hypothetical protein